MPHGSLTKPLTLPLQGEGNAWYGSSSYSSTMTMADVVPSEELRSFLIDRTYARRRRPTAPSPIVFSDIESSTVLLERLGDTEFLRMLAWHDRIVRDTAKEHRGFVVKSQGDGFMLAFLPPRSRCARASLCEIESPRASPVCQ